MVRTRSPEGGLVAVATDLSPAERAIRRIRRSLSPQIGLFRQTAAEARRSPPDLLGSAVTKTSRPDLSNAAAPAAARSPGHSAPVADRPRARIGLPASRSSRRGDLELDDQRWRVCRGGASTVTNTRFSRRSTASRSALIWITRDQDASRPRLIQITPDQDTSRSRLIWITRDRDASHPRLIRITEERDASPAGVIRITRDQDASCRGLIRITRKPAALLSVALPVDWEPIPPRCSSARRRQGVLSAGAAASTAASGAAARCVVSHTLRGTSSASASSSDPGTSGSACAATRFT